MGALVTGWWKVLQRLQFTGESFFVSDSLLSWPFCNWDQEVNSVPLGRTNFGSTTEAMASTFTVIERFIAG